VSAAVGALQALSGRVSDVRSTIGGYGDPSRLAGDPGALRSLATSHFDTAGDLRDALDRGHGAATGLAGGTWQGGASGAFGDHWSTVTTRVSDLAGRHWQYGDTLTGLAGRAERLNTEVVEVVDACDAWLPMAAAAVATENEPACVELVPRGTAILDRWDELHPELDSFAGGLWTQLDVDLGIDLPSPWPMPVGGLGGPITIPLPGVRGIPGLGTVVHDEEAGEGTEEEGGGGDGGDESGSDDVPDYVDETLDEVDSTGHGPQAPGRKGGGEFENDGRGDGEELPREDENGDPITYREWDVKDPDPVEGRGAERLVTGSDGSAYYTDDHYQTFKRIR
jgi:guanyl-specific ribonuclease Sa/uncharacterized protein YukE